MRRWLAAGTVVLAGCGSTSHAAVTTALRAISSISDGAALSDPVEWIASAAEVPAGDSVARVDFLIDGRRRWTDRDAPYAFSGGLEPWLVGGGEHRLAVRVVTRQGRTASTSSAVTVTAQPVPTALVGDFEAGRWRIQVRAGGVLSYAGPHRSSGNEAFVAMPDGTLTIAGPAAWLLPPGRRAGLCRAAPPAAYGWAARGRNLVLTVDRDPCARRRLLLARTWRRTAN